MQQITDRFACFDGLQIGALGGSEAGEVLDVSFYERFGFEGVGERKVPDMTNWFMLRRAEGRRA